MNLEEDSGNSFSQIDILTPVKNRETFIGHCADSLAFQKTSYNWYIQDCLSSDNTVSIIEALDNQNIFFSSSQDAGQSDALNILIKKSKAEIIGWLNADEMYFPGTLEFVKRYFVENPKIDVLVGDVMYVDQRGRIIEFASIYPLIKFNLRNRGCIFSTVGCFFRRSALEDFEFDMNLSHLLDWDFFLNLIERRKKISWCPQLFGIFTVHDNQITALKLPRNSDQHSIVRDRYGIAGSKVKILIGDIIHRGSKILFGSILRETLVRRYLGKTIINDLGINFKLLIEIKKNYVVMKMRNRRN